MMRTQILQYDLNMGGRPLTLAVQAIRLTRPADLTYRQLLYADMVLVLNRGVPPS